MTPAPSVSELVGTATLVEPPEASGSTQGFLTSATRNMGPDYSGDCSELETVPPMGGGHDAAKSGNVYCGVIELDDDRRILARAKVKDIFNWDSGEPFYEDPQILVESPAQPAAPVPTIPIYLLLALSGLLALVGTIWARVTSRF